MSEICGALHLDGSWLLMKTLSYLMHPTTPRATTNCRNIIGSTTRPLSPCEMLKSARNVASFAGVFNFPNNNEWWEREGDAIKAKV